jgi:DNA-binding winged helix-turn-helix (wHTH) protein
LFSEPEYFVDGEEGALPAEAGMQRGSTEPPVLIGQTGPLNGQRWHIEQELLLGRDETCDIVIADRQVSRFHARLSLADDGVLLEDLGSKNGTFHNGERIEEPVLLSDGDLVQVSVIQHFVFLSSDATVPLEMDSFPEKGNKQQLYLDTRSRRVWVNGMELVPPLSVPQFRLLQILFEQEGRVVERQDLINYIWGEEEAVGVSEQAFDALVRRLRDRLAMVNPRHTFITTVRGHGLRLDNPTERHS